MKLLYNANIHTLDSNHPSASAILIAGGRIIAVGDKSKLESLVHGKVEKQDMKGKTILPGLTDAHLHIQHYALSLTKIDCETKTKQKCLNRVAERVKKAKPGEWILGHGWNHNEWSGNGEWPTAVELDAIEQTVTAGASNLSYDATTDQYIYVWKTDKSWAGTCRTFVLKLNDGSYHRADFKFKK